MKVLLQAFIGAAIIHLIYFFTNMAVGYVVTLIDRPNMAMYWEDAEGLPKEVALGTTVSPFLHVVTFVGVMLTCGILLSCYKRISTHLSL